MLMNPNAMLIKKTCTVVALGLGRGRAKYLGVLSYVEHAKIFHVVTATCFMCISILISASDLFNV